MTKHDGDSHDGRSHSLEWLARRWLPAMGWMALIFALSARPDIPSAPSGWLDFALKKGLHAAGYAVLAVLCLRAIGASRGSVAAALAWGVTVLYAASDEWHQSFVPGRSAAAFDVVVDAFGAAAGLVLSVWRGRRRRDA